jgi:hypothetical protein
MYIMENNLILQELTIGEAQSIDGGKISWAAIVEFVIDNWPDIKHAVYDAKTGN